MQRIISILLAIGLMLAVQSVSAGFLHKPEIISVYDGDTLTARFNIWINQYVVSSVRVLGVDTPELGYRAKCEKEVALAVRAREYVIEKLKGDILVDVVGNDKFGGRVKAWVYVDGIGLDKLLIKEGLGREYSGGKRKGWCE